jgi:hypothetical protein
MSDKDWISVEDRLPDDKKRYLICTESGRIDIAYYQPMGDKFSNHESFWQGSSCRFTAVTHWMPLSEPPKGEENSYGRVYQRGTAEIERCENNEC